VVRRTVLPLLLAALALLPAGASRAIASSRVFIPSGWLSHLALGVSDSPGDAQALRAHAPVDMRYQYLAGGVNTGHGWATWNPNGSFVSMYVPHENDTWDHFRDNRLQWWFGPGSDEHMRATADSGVIGMLFGAGADGNTTPQTDGGLYYRLARRYEAHPLALGSTS
jgi:hypothetical protein